MQARRVTGSRSLLLVLLMGVGLLLAACQSQPAAPTQPPAAAQPKSAGEKITLRFAGQHPVGHMGTKALENIKKAVEEKTSGRVRIDTYPANQLGEYTQVYAEVQKGTIDLALISITGEYNPLFELQWLPYLGEDYQQTKKAFSRDSVLSDLISSYHEKLGVKNLGFFSEGFIGIGSKKMPSSPAAANKPKDLLIRVGAFKVSKLVAEDLGYRTTTMNYGDTFAGIQTGVVDGWLGGTPSLNYEGFRDVIKYYVPINCFMEATTFVMNLNRYNSLPVEDRRIVEEAVRAASEGSFALAEQEDKQYLEKMKTSGITIVNLSDDDLKSMAQYVRSTTWPKLNDMWGAEGKAAMDKVLQSLK